MALKVILFFPGKDAYHLLKVALRKSDREDVVRELEKVAVQKEDFLPTDSAFTLLPSPCILFTITNPFI